MKTFTKDMLVPGKHVVETRSGERYLVLECNGEIYLANLEKFFSSIDYFNVDMTYQSFSVTSKYSDIMKVFVITSPGVITEATFCDRDLKEVWRRKEIFITPDEKAILRNIKGYKYIARDKNNKLFVYYGKPYKYKSEWDYSDETYEKFLLFDHLFQMVQWTDDEPWKIEDLLKLPEKE